MGGTGLLGLALGVATRDGCCLGSEEFGIACQQDREQGEHQNRALQEQRRTVDDDRSGHRGAGGIVQSYDCGEGADEAGRRDEQLSGSTNDAWRKRLDEHPDDRRPRKRSGAVR